MAAKSLFSILRLFSSFQVPPIGEKFYVLYVHNFYLELEVDAGARSQQNCVPAVCFYLSRVVDPRSRMRATRAPLARTV